MEIYSSGKVLLTGEYVILDGALSLASPTKSGQHLRLKENQSNLIIWKSINYDGNIWFECSIENETLEIESTSSKKISDILIKIISLIRESNPSFLAKTGSTISTELTFNKDWGLGSSSSLIYSLSQVAEVDPYFINSTIFKGSGYDIACANSDSPLLYKINRSKRMIKKINFRPIFHNNIYFIYLNKKQNTLSEIKNYRDQEKSKLAESEISDITIKVSNCNNLNKFNDLIDSHEKIISKLINREPIKDKLFKDFRGSMKSLGAWGGDFIMVTSENDPSTYFRDKGYTTVIKFEDMVI